MINETEEFENTPDGIMAIAEAKRMGLSHGKPLSTEAVQAVVAFFNAPEGEREWVLSLIGTMVCRECGKPSCLHGYSDD